MGHAVLWQVPVPTPPGEAARSASPKSGAGFHGPANNARRRQKENSDENKKVSNAIISQSCL